MFHNHSQFIIRFIIIRSRLYVSQLFHNQLCNSRNYGYEEIAENRKKSEGCQTFSMFSSKIQNFLKNVIILKWKFQHFEIMELLNESILKVIWSYWRMNKSSLSCKNFVKKIWMWMTLTLEMFEKKKKETNV